MSEKTKKTKRFEVITRFGKHYVADRRTLKFAATDEETAATIVKKANKTAHLGDKALQSYLEKAEKEHGL